ncbi:Uncharacterised protein [Bordetella ansorpii]|uniref:Uncharacterized protein n=1 Tax=Bordetella ansorpii TaxID=288768 RepID=A0A157QLI4_9BORD|nr:hypothetical protein [Bordetella ansorpii]SAI46763.1 Uncharacterised protein [Bordetella ansorpii]
MQQDTATTPSTDLPFMHMDGFKLRWLYLSGAEWAQVYACQEAYAMGRYDFQSGETAPPPLLADIYALASHWREGYRDQEQAYEISQCACCQNNLDDANPCSVHGR